jgi:hypothetical protein
MLKKSSWIICFLLLAISCLDEPDCFRLNNNIVGIAFRKIRGGEADTVALIGVQASGTDSVFNQYVIGTDFYLPLNFFDTQTSFFIQGLERNYQLATSYVVKSQFVSDECGARFVLSDLSILDHDVDSIRMYNNTPFTSEAGTNIVIYRCPILNRVEVSFRQLDIEGNSAVKARKINNVVDDLGVSRYSQTELAAIYLPLNPAANSSTFSLSMADQAEASLLSMSYVKRIRKFYEICGVQEAFAGLDTTSTAHIDSLDIIQDSIQDPPVTNIVIYKCPQTNMMQLYFKQPGTGTQVKADTLHVKSVKDDLGRFYYQNSDPLKGYTTFDLPLNEAQGSTTFTFDIFNTPGVTTYTKTLKVLYVRTPNKFYNACPTQYIFSELSIEPSPDVSKNFTNPNTIKKNTVTYPIARNIEIIQ